MDLKYTVERKIEELCRMISIGSYKDRVREGILDISKMKLDNSDYSEAILILLNWMSCK